MSKEIKTNLQFDAKEVIVVEDRVLVQPGPVKEVLTIERVPVNTGKKLNTPVKTKEERRITKSNYRIGEIISVHPSDEVYKIGDVITYNVRDGIALDILSEQDPDPNCPVMVRKFNIAAKVNVTLEEVKGRIVTLEEPKSEDN
jgi:hypothetical protein